MKEYITFEVSQEDGCYIATAIEYPIVTQAESFELLQVHIREAVELFFSETSDTQSPEPVPYTIVLNYQMPIASNYA